MWMRKLRHEFRIDPETSIGHNRFANKACRILFVTLCHIIPASTHGKGLTEGNNLI